MHNKTHCVIHCTKFLILLYGMQQKVLKHFTSLMSSNFIMPASSHGQEPLLVVYLQLTYQSKTVK